MSLDTVHNIVTVAMLIVDILLVILAFVFSGKKAKALEQESRKNAVLCETAERICTLTFCILLLFTLVNMDLQTVTNGFINVIKRLEVLVHG